MPSALGEREQHRRREAAERGEHLAGDGLLGLLQVGHLGADRSRAARPGRSMPTGSSAKIADTRLLYTPRSPGERTDTGTSVRTTLSTDSPREISRSRKPPVMPASTMSLTVPPSALSHGLDVGELRARPAPAAVGPERSVQRGRRRRPRSRRACAAGRCAASRPGARASAAPASAARQPRSGLIRVSGQRSREQLDAAPGAGRGFQLCAREAAPAVGSRSSITVSRSVPATPSTMQWWIFDSSAQRCCRQSPR